MSPRLEQVNVRLPDLTRRQIGLLRQALDLRSDAAVVTMAIDRMAQAELPDWRKLADMTLTNLQAIANLVDDPTVAEIIDHVADRLGYAMGLG